MVSEKIMKINEMLEEYPNTFSDLKSQLIRFAIDNEEAIKLVKVELNAKLDDRTQDNWLPLLKIAKYIEESIKQFSKEYAETNDTPYLLDSIYQL
jgi:hypothetical protein